ncbi:MAG: UDP-N-acetylmuramoyl-tripeptide--D-alanyl-D-alanine ligase [Acidobacteriota bacterium]
MIEATLLEVATVLGAKMPGRGDRDSLAGTQFPPVSIDSRTLTGGQCFVAIKGPRFDGHEFIREALGKQARVVIHSRRLESWAQQAQCCFLRVRDTVAALQTLGHYVRRKWGRQLIAITGSMGKTTTRHFTSSLLEGRFRVLQSPGNLNNEFGVPLSLLGLEDSHQLAVLELGMNQPGEIRLLSRICGPDLGVVTNVAPVHLEFFPGLDAIAAAKAEILESLPGGGRLVFNADDGRVVQIARRFPGTKISFGFDDDSDIVLGNFRVQSLQKMEFELGTRGRLRRYQVPFAGRHFLYSIAAAAATAVALGLSWEEVGRGLRRLRPLAMRGRVLVTGPVGGGGVTLLDESYNSNPESVRAVLETVQALEGFRRKILALGEMLELGEASPQLHRQVGRQVARMGVDLLVTVGARALSIQEGAGEAGLPARRMRHFEDSKAAAAFLAAQLEGGDFVLSKGSRATGMDRIVRQLEARGETQEA